MDGSGSTGQYLPVVTIGADGQLRAVTDPSILPNHSNMTPEDIGEEVSCLCLDLLCIAGFRLHFNTWFSFLLKVIVFPDKSVSSDVLPEGIVEIDVDTGSDDISQETISLDQPNQLPIVTTFLGPAKVLLTVL